MQDSKKYGDYGVDGYDSEYDAFCAEQNGGYDVEPTHESAAELISVEAFSPEIFFDDEEGSGNLIDRFEFQCKVEYLGGDGDECVRWMKAIFNGGGLHFVGPECLMDGNVTSDSLYEVVSAAMAEVIDFRLYDLGEMTNDQRIEITHRDAEMILEKVESCDYHTFNNGNEVCTGERLGSGGPDDFHFVHGPTGDSIAITSVDQLAFIANNTDAAFECQAIEQELPSHERGQEKSRRRRI